MLLVTAEDSGDTLDRSKENHVMAGSIQALTFFRYIRLFGKIADIDDVYAG